MKTRILFLDASNEVLIKRYESVRRPHPLQQGNRLIDGILEERDLLKNLKEHADIVIDTSALSIHQLSTKLYEGLLGSGPTTVSVHIFSFGFKYGIPIDADFVADVRFLPNPFWVPELRSLTGKDKPVSDYVLSSEGAEEFLDAYEKAIAIAIEGYAQEDKHYVTIAFGCTGGQHRSVAMSEALAKRCVRVVSRSPYRPASWTSVRPIDDRIVRRQYPNTKKSCRLCPSYSVSQ